MKYPFDYKEVQSLKPEELFAILDDWLNCHSARSCPKGFYTALNSTHRTLQESFISFVWSCLLMYADTHKEDWSFDARNEDAVKLCRKLEELVKKDELPTYLRYI